MGLPETHRLVTELFDGRSEEVCDVLDEATCRTACFKSSARGCPTSIAYIVFSPRCCCRTARSRIAPDRLACA